MERLWPARQIFVTLPAGLIDPAWAEILKTYRPGGIFVNVPDAAHAADVSATIKQAKEIVGIGAGQSEVPLALVDQEGGTGNPLGINPAPSPRELGESGDAGALRETALRFAAAARAAGVAAILGPRLDLATAMNDNANLCFGSSSDQVSDNGIAFARALAEGGVLPVLRHYPGTGTAVRTASGPPIMAETNLEALADIMLPFANAAAEQLPGMLVGCVTVPALDKSQTARPACASPVMVQGILRDKWAYQGVVLADVTRPALAAPVALDVFVTNCLGAGCDAVLLGPLAPGEFEQICRTLAVALRDGALNTDRMAASRARLASWSLALKMETPASEKQPAETQVPPPITDATPPVPAPAEAPEAKPAEPVTEVPAVPATTPAEAPAAKPAAEPEPAPPAKAPEAAPTGSTEHTIAPGETLNSISKKYGVPLAEILKQNNLGDGNNIQAGAKLKIQVPPAAEAAVPAPASETPPTVVQEAAPAPEAAAAPTPPVTEPAKTEAEPAEQPEPAKTESAVVPETKAESDPEAKPKEESAPESQPKNAPEAKPETPEKPVEPTVPTPESPTVSPESAATPAPPPVVEAKPAETAREPEKAAQTEGSGQYEMHVVQSGENLYRLGVNNGTTKEELMRLNGITDPSLLKVGATIKIPKKDASGTQPAATALPLKKKKKNEAVHF